MIYNRSKGWYFIHVPKNAGSAVLRRYVRIGKQVGGNNEFSNEDLLRNRSELGLGAIRCTGHTIHNKASYWAWSEETNNMHPIAILRNPWARCLSIYLFQLKICQENIKEEWASIDHPILIAQGFKKAWMEGGFFVDSHAVHVERNEQTGRSWSYADDQYSWLEGVEGAKWFRLEDQMQEFCKYTQIQYPNKFNTTQKTDYRKYYDDELAERIGSLFYRDVTLGHYEF